MAGRGGFLPGITLIFLAMAGCFSSPPPPEPARPPSWGQREDLRYQSALLNPPPPYNPPVPQDTLLAAADYRRARPTAPASIQVLSIPPRQNNYPEFDYALQDGLSPPPALAALPGAPGALLADVAAADAGTNPNRYPARLGAAAAPSAGATDISAAGGYAGLLQQHFRPVEQLVYGGDQGDADRPETYRLQPRDTVELFVRDHPEFTGPQEVAADGTLGVPHTADRVPVRGKTVAEAENAMRQAVAPYIKGKAEARLVPARTRGQWYYVFGAVRSPGRFPLGAEPVKLSEALLAADWVAQAVPAGADLDELGPAFPAAQPRGRYAPLPEANLEAVEVYTPHRSRPAQSVHDARAALLGGVSGDDPYVRPGQVVVVPYRDPAKNAELRARITMNQ